MTIYNEVTPADLTNPYARLVHLEGVRMAKVKVVQGSIGLGMATVKLVKVISGEYSEKEGGVVPVLISNLYTFIPEN